MLKESRAVAGFGSSSSWVGIGVGFMGNESEPISTNQLISSGFSSMGSENWRICDVGLAVELWRKRKRGA